MQNQPRKKPLNKFVRLTGIGLQMGITIYLAAYFGKRIDAHYQFEKKYATLGLILFAFIGSLYSLLVQLKKINEKDS
jgi:membrane protein DedA with SNARE-associated domain|uniref:AtpZ/AtpI family protein n=1 Tax=Polaribacter sp. TaxID=1920175 RepID=UPI0040485DD7